MILTYRGNRAGGLERVERIEKDGGTAVALPLDVARTDTLADFRSAVEQVLQERWGRTSFDFLVNNAGVGQSRCPSRRPPRNCSTRCSGST